MTGNISVSEGESKRGRQWALVAAVVYLAVGFGVQGGVWTGDPARQVIGAGDSMLYSWFIEYAYQAIIHLHDPFFTTLGNVPGGIDVLANTSVMVLGVAVSPVTAIFGPIAGFNVLTTLALPTSAMAAYFLVGRFVERRWICFFGGLIFGFSPYEIAEASAGHVALTFLAPIPLIFLALHDIVVARPERWVRNGIVLAAACVFEFFASTELLVATAMVAAVVLVAVAVVGRRRLKTSVDTYRALGVAAVVGGVVLAYPVWAAVAGPGHIVGPAEGFSAAYRADMLGSIVPDSHQLLAPAALQVHSNFFANSIVENGSYLGIPLVLVAVIGSLWLWRHSIALVAAVAGGFAYVMSLGGALALYRPPALGPNNTASGTIPLPEGLLSRAPIFQSILPVRFGCLVDLATVVVLGIVLEQLTTRLAAHREKAKPTSKLAWRRMVVPAVVIAVAVPLIPRLPANPPTTVRPPPFFLQSRHPEIPPGSVALLLPYPTGTTAQETAWDALDGLPFRMLGGYYLVPAPDGTSTTKAPTLFTVTKVVTFGWKTPFSEPATTVFLQAMKGVFPKQTSGTRQHLLDELAQYRVRTVIEDPTATLNSPAMVGLLTWLLGPPSAHEGGTVDWFAVTAGARMTPPEPPRSR